MPACTHHPEATAVSPCLGCGRPFCASCLVAHQGRLLCGPCRDAGLALLQQDKPGAIHVLRVVRACSVAGVLLFLVLAMVCAYLSTAATAIFAGLMILSAVTALTTQVILWIVEAITSR
jgi:hypothetical protein